MDSQQDSKTHSASKGEPEKKIFFPPPYCLQKHILFISGCPSSHRVAARTVLDDADTRNPPIFAAFLALLLFPCSNHPAPSRPHRHLHVPVSSFNAATVENQTALKQIDVRFNIVVTSSQGPCASASVTTAGLLSLAPAVAATLLVASMIHRREKRTRKEG